MKNLSVVLLVSALWLHAVAVTVAALPTEEASELRVLSFNAWLLDVRRDARSSAEVRLALMKEEMLKLNPDLITFQEVWGENYRSRVKALCESLGLSFSGFHSDVPVITPGVKLAAGALILGVMSGRYAYKQFKSPSCQNFYKKMMGSVGGVAGVAGLGSAGVLAVADQRLTRDFGNGLFFCSRHPIRDIRSFNFDSHTAPEEFALYRSVVMLRLDVPNLGGLQVFSSHLGPIRFDQASSRNLPSDIANNDRQFEQMVRWVESQRDAKTPMLLTGDLNINLFEFEGQGFTGKRAPRYDQLTEGQNTSLKLVDSYAEIHGRPFPPPLDSLTDGPVNLNGYLNEKVHRGNTHPLQILDYIFYDDGGGKMQAVDSRVVLNKRYAPPPIEAKMDYESRFGRSFPLVSQEEQESLKQKTGVERLPYHLSDHFGVFSVFRLNPPN